MNSQPANLLPQDGEVYYYPNFFSPSESDTIFETLMKETQWKQEPIKIFGKEVMQPRLTAYYGDGERELKYSGITMQSHAWTPTLFTIKKSIEPSAGIHFNGVLLNQYRNEKDSMGWHRDNEKELGKDPVIASVNFGATRKFKLRHYFNKKLTASIELEHGSLLIMKGTTQHFWEHSVAKVTAETLPRINLTFRYLYS